MSSRMISNFNVSAILGVGHFELCFKMLYFLNALSYRYENNYKNVWLHALKLLKKFGGSATLWSKVIMKYLKNANNFWKN